MTTQQAILVFVLLAIVNINIAPTLNNFTRIIFSIAWLLMAVFYVIYFFLGEGNKNAETDSSNKDKGRQGDLR